MTGEGVLVTRPADHAILHGITRATLIRIARSQGLETQMRAFTIEEAQSAREAFVTSATSFITPVVQIDNRPVGNGVPGSLATALRQAYLDSA